MRIVRVSFLLKNAEPLLEGLSPGVEQLSDACESLLKRGPLQVMLLQLREPRVSVRPFDFRELLSAEFVRLCTVAPHVLRANTRALNPRKLQTLT